MAIELNIQTVNSVRKLNSYGVRSLNELRQPQINFL